MLADIATASGRGCDAMWFSRNVIFDKAGFCFSSNLGKAIFDNSNCKTNSSKLSPADKQTVALLKQAEKQWECTIDTSGSKLNSTFIPLLRNLDDQPIPSISESYCGGYKGVAPIKLLSARNKQSHVVGTLEKGDNITWAYDLIEGWDFLIVSTNGSDGKLFLGWTKESFLLDDCEFNAG